MDCCRNILKEVGQAQLDISSHLTEYEMAMENDIIQNINSILEVSLFSPDGTKWCIT